METPTPETSILERLFAGELSKAELARHVQEAVYSRAMTFCDIPDAYRHCTLAFRCVDFEDWDETKMRLFASIKHPQIINPDRAQLLPVKFFQLLMRGHPSVCEKGDPLRPLFGAYLYGRPGTGKTHVMAAAALAAKAVLDKRLTEVRGAISAAVDRLYEGALNVSKDFRDPVKGQGRFVFREDGGIDNPSAKEPSVWFDEQLEALKGKIAKAPWKPTDLLYLSFDQLREHYGSDASHRAVAAAIENAWLLFIDDVDLKKTRDGGIELFQELLQRRYELGRPGVVVSTNLTAKQLGGGDDKMARRLVSRCGAMLFRVHFKGSDWRTTMHARRLQALREEIIGLIATEDELDASEPVAGETVDDAASGTSEPDSGERPSDEELGGGEGLPVTDAV